MTSLKTQLGELKKGCDLCVGAETPSPVFIYCDSCQAKIFLLSQIIDDLKEEWQRLDRQICNSAFKEFEYERQGLMKFISQITGMSSEELKEVLK